MLNQETLSLALAEHWEFHCLYFTHVLQCLLPRDAFLVILQENGTYSRLLTEYVLQLPTCHWLYNIGIHVKKITNNFFFYKMSTEKYLKILNF